LISRLNDSDAVITKNGIPVASVVKYDRYVKMVDFLEKVKDIYFLDVGSSVIKDPIENMFEDN